MTDTQIVETNVCRKQVGQDVCTVLRLWLYVQLSQDSDVCTVLQAKLCVQLSQDLYAGMLETQANMQKQHMQSAPAEILATDLQPLLCLQAQAD